MNVKRIDLILAALLFVTGSAYAADETGINMAAPDAATVQQMQAQMQIMQEQMKQFQNATTAEARQKIWQEHLMTMRQHMNTMGCCGGMGIGRWMRMHGAGMGPGMGPGMGKGPGMGPGMGNGMGSGRGPGMGKGMGPCGGAMNTPAETEPAK